MTFRVSGHQFWRSEPWVWGLRVTDQFVGGSEVLGLGIWGIPIIRCTFLGVPIIRTIVF